MTATPTQTHPPDDLDRLFSDFFKAQLKQPWPNAPLPPVAAKSAQPAEPATLVTARAAEAPAAPARRDSGARARVTLAASVALMLGTCWYLSNGVQPGTRPAPAPKPNGPGLFEAGANDTGVLPQIEKNKAIGAPPKIDMGEID